jgi:hypothetical protein
VSDGVADTGPGRAKTSALGRKTVPGPFRGGGATEGKDTKGCENDTHLATVEPPGGLPQRSCLGAGLAVVRGRTGLQASDGNNLVSGPHLKHEGVGTAAEDGKGAVVEWLKRRDGTTAADPNKAGGDELGW